MLQIIENTVDLEFPVGTGINTLIAQIPNHLKLTGRFFKIDDAKRQTDLFLSIFDLASDQTGEERLHFIIFPESSLPFEAFDQVMKSINTISPGFVPLIHFE